MAPETVTNTANRFWQAFPANGCPDGVCKEIKLRYNSKIKELDSRGACHSCIHRELKYIQKLMEEYLKRNATKNTTE